MKQTMLVVGLLVLLPVLARADGDLKSRADAAWEARENPAQARVAVDLYQQLAAKDPADVESRLRVARGTYWLLEELKVEMEKEQKTALYDRAIKGCNDIIARDEDNVGAWYWFMWDQGARTLINGVFSGWDLRAAIVGTIMVAKGNVNYDSGGVYRYWGKVIYETPGLMGKFLHFSGADSVWLYRQALKVEPKYLPTHLFLAETFEELGRAADAKKEYQFCVDQPDNTLPLFGPETRLYKRLAREKLAKL